MTESQPQFLSRFLKMFLKALILSYMYTLNACLDRVFTGSIYRHEFSSQDNFGTMLLFTCTICALLHMTGFIYSNELTLPIGRLHPCFSSTGMKHNKNVYVHGLPGMKCLCNCKWFPVVITGLYIVILHSSKKKLKPYTVCISHKAIFSLFKTEWYSSVG